MSSMPNGDVEYKVMDSLYVSGVERHVCVCGKHYKNKGTLVWHLKHQCGKAPAHKCHLCSYQTSVRSSILRHLRRVHKLDLPLERYTLLRPELNSFCNKPCSTATNILVCSNKPQQT